MQNWELSNLHSGAWLRLKKAVPHLQGFHAFILQHNNPAYRDGLIANLHEVPESESVLILDLKILGDFEHFEQKLDNLTDIPRNIHIINFESLDADNRDGKKCKAFFKGLNYHRNLIADLANTTLFFWLVESHTKEMPDCAPDFWAWREQVIDFLLPIEMPERWEPTFKDFTGLEREKKQARIHEIKTFLSEKNHSEPRYSYANLYQELGDLYEALCEYEFAKVSFQKAERLFFRLDEGHAQLSVKRSIAYLKFRQGNPSLALSELQKIANDLNILGDTKLYAKTLDTIADIYYQLGDHEKSLQLRQSSILPLFDKLHDNVNKAITMAKIAEIYKVRGDFDEALSILKHEVLPIFEKRGDSRAKAITMGNIAEILQKRGQLDEALSIYQNVELPIYEKLGDIHSKAVTMGNIADILERRGQFDEAIKIRQNDEIPIYEQLGDIRKKAQAKTRNADILQVRGQFDEALEILQNDVLPIFEKLGCNVEKALTIGRIATLLWEKSPQKNADKVRDDLNEVLSYFQSMKLPDEIAWIEGVFKSTGLSRNKGK